MKRPFSNPFQTHSKGSGAELLDFDRKALEIAQIFLAQTPRKTFSSSEEAIKGIDAAIDALTQLKSDLATNFFNCWISIDYRRQVNISNGLNVMQESPESLEIVFNDYSFMGKSLGQLWDPKRGTESHGICPAPFGPVSDPVPVIDCTRPTPTEHRKIKDKTARAFPTSNGASLNKPPVNVHDLAGRDIDADHNIP
jgi:hypothetical protein